MYSYNAPFIPYIYKGGQRIRQAFSHFFAKRRKDKGG